MLKQIASFFSIFFVFSPWLLTLLFFFNAEAEEIYAWNNFSFIREEEGAGEFLIKLKGAEEPRLIFGREKEIKKEFGAGLEHIEKNNKYRLSALPNDQYFSEQWYLKKIRAQSAWDIRKPGRGSVVAVIDSGVQIDHPDLTVNIWKNSKEIPKNGLDDDKNGYVDDVNGWDFVNNVSDPGPKFSAGFTEAGVMHGTIIAGIIAGASNNLAGIAGISKDARIMPLKVLDDKGDGKASNVIKAIDYAVKNGAQIINLSFVGFDYSYFLENAIKRAYDAGVIIVAAAGNEEGGSGYFLDNKPMYPACYDGSEGNNWVIGVAATDALDQKTAFSSYGTKCVDVSSPGTSFFSTLVYSPDKSINGRYFNQYYGGYWSGTSMAAAVVSAAASLVAETNPDLESFKIIDIIKSAADNINNLNPSYNSQLGAGRINLYSAVKQANYLLDNKQVALLISPAGGRESAVLRTNKDGGLFAEFLAYAPNFKGGVEVASGDVDGDGENEIITGAGPGGGPHVRVFKSKGELYAQFFSFNQAYRGGTHIAACDLNKDGKDEIIAGAGRGTPPLVRVFSGRGAVITEFYAYNFDFRGGVNVACGDVDGDKENEIITGAGPGGGPQVRIFSPRRDLEGQFFAYDKSLRGGVNVAVGDAGDGLLDGKKEIIVSPGPGSEPRIKIFDNYANLRGSFLAYNGSFLGGVDVAAGDVDKDGSAEIITGAGPGGGPHARIFEASGKIIGSFYAFNNDFTGGINVAFWEKLIR